MSRLLKEIEAREELLNLRINKLEKKQADAPVGRLRVSMDKNMPRYYEVCDTGDSKGKYLPKEQIEKARFLAQADYEKKILSLLKQEKVYLRKIADFYRGFSCRQGEEFYSGPEELFYSRLIPARKELIVPIAEDQSLYTKNWLSETYEKKAFSADAPEYYTAGGIRVRSKTEWMIAEMLEKKNVPFYYERPLQLKGTGTVHPDFTALNVRQRKTMVWEHLGMMDDEQYREHALSRIEAYEQNGFYPGINLILTHETASRPIRSKTLESMIEIYLLQ